MEGGKEACLGDGQLNSSDPHWEKLFHTEKREMLMIFKDLQRQGLIKPHFTMFDMIQYLAYQEREAFMERSCKMTGTVDGQSCLIWEVKVIMKLLDIQHKIDQGLGLMKAKESLPTAVFNFETSSSSSSSQKAVDTAVKVIGYRFIYCPFAREHYLSEIVVDVVAKLAHAIETSLTDEAHLALSLFLRGKAGNIAVEVLRKLPQDKMAYYTHLTAVRLVHSLQRKLKSTEMINMTGNGDSDGLMAEITSVILDKLVKHFSCSVPLESTDMLTLLLKASERKPPSASMKLVIHADTVTCVLVLVLRLIFPDEDDVAAQLHVWPVLDEVVDRLAICGGKVTRNNQKANLYIHIKEMIEMAQIIYDQLVNGSGSPTVLQYAVSARARMASRDLAGFVTEAILKAHQKRLENLVSTAEEIEPFLNQAVLRDLVARFVYQLFPVSNSLLKYFQLVDQLCALIQQDITEDSALPRALEALQQSTVTVIQGIARECYSGYLQDFPVRDDWDIDSFLTDKDHCKQTSGMIVKSLLHHFKDLLAPPQEENKDVEEPEASRADVVDHTDEHFQDNNCAEDITAEIHEHDNTSCTSKAAPKKSRGFFKMLRRACCCCVASQEAD